MATNPDPGSPGGFLFLLVNSAGCFLKYVISFHYPIQAAQDGGLQKDQNVIHWMPWINKFH